MKKSEMSDKKVLGFIALIVAAMIALLLIIMLPLSCSPSCAKAKTNESIEKINNPDQGFYRPIYVKVTEDGATYNERIINDSTQLYHLRVDISAFSKAVNGDKDKDLTASALDGVETLLQTLRLRGKNAVVRFAYDPQYNGKANLEPSIEMMKKHVGQISARLNKYPVTVTAVEVGLLGPYGEMHTSTAATLENKVILANEYLENTKDSGLAILVRTPNVIYKCLGITLNDIDGYVIPKDSLYYRLGLFNDGYLGTSNDTGTFTNREREVKFMSVQNGHLPYGGEVIVPSSTMHDIDKCTPEMFEMGLSYLNVEWNNEVIDKWKKTYYTRSCGDDKLYYGTTAFDYIQNHMGYRFVLRGSSLKYSNGEIKAKLKIENVGFGNLLKEKQVKLIFENGSGEIIEAAGGTYKGGNLNFSVKCKLSGKYKVYLCLYGESLDGKPNYAVQLANKDIWNEQYKANFIGNIKI